MIVGFFVFGCSKISKTTQAINSGTGPVVVSSSIVGIWKSLCTLDSSSNKYQQEKYEFKGTSELIWTKYKDAVSSDCSDGYEYKSSGSFALPEQSDVNGNQFINFSLESVEIKPLSYQSAQELNSLLSGAIGEPNGACGIQVWQENMPIDVSARSCLNINEAPQFTSIYSVFKIEGATLQTGVTSGTANGTSLAKRYVNLGTTSLTRQ
jgi:hypothetical protein